MTTTLLALEALLSQAIGDYREIDTSTNVSTNNYIYASTLNNLDDGEDDYFKNHWVYFTEGNNSGKNRPISAWKSTASRMTVRGSALSAEAAAVTLRLHKFNRENKVRALNRAIELLYPSLFKELDDLTLVTGNHLPDASFEWWTSSSALKLYSASNSTLARTSSGAYTRGQLGTYSMKATNTAANGYAYISSNTYPKLLDLMGKTVNLYCWAYPETANDPTVVIYTLQADGTAQTLSSLTAAPAGKWTLLELPDQTLNDDLVQIDIRFKVATNLKYCYFDDAILCGMNLYEYLLPYNFQIGNLSQAYIQAENYSDIYAYDIHPREWAKEPFTIVNDGTYRYLKLDSLWDNYHRIRLTGYRPLESLSSDTDTISLDGEKVNLIIAYAAHLLYEMEKGMVSSEDRERYQEESNYWYAKVREYRPTLQMIRPAHYLRTGV